jgi:hypothetical protein
MLLETKNLPIKIEKKNELQINQSKKNRQKKQTI